MQLPPAPKWGTQADPGQVASSPNRQALWLLTVLTTWGPSTSLLSPTSWGGHTHIACPYTERLLSTFIWSQIPLVRALPSGSHQVYTSQCLGIQLGHQSQGP